MNLFLKRKKNKHYRWVSKDRKTKFRIFALSTRKREYDKGVKKMYKNIKYRFYDQFLAAKNKGKKFNFTSDKLAHYKKGFNKYFRNVATLTHGVPIACKKYKLKRNNNCIERDHQYSRKLENNARGHKSFFGATALFNLGDVYYNFIDKQRLMKKCKKTKRWIPKEKGWRTPAQRAGIKINLGENYQLLNLIKLVSADN